MPLIFDCETNGFYADAHTVHCIAAYDVETKQFHRFSHHRGPSIEEGLRLLMSADQLIGHNIVKYDLPVLRKIYPWFEPRGDLIDTLIMSRLLVPELGDSDDKLIKRGKLPPKYRGLHKLEAWGWRLGVLKDEYAGGFDAWSPEMDDYCLQDVKVTKALLDTLSRLPAAPQAFALEHEVARIIVRQEINGFHFDEAAAHKLLVKLAQERLTLEADLKERFGFWFARDGRDDFTPKKDDTKRGYTAGAPMTKVKAVYFNPGSRQHIARVLTRQFGWRPTSFTPTGEPEVNEESLKAITHPEAKSLLRYLMVEKRIGQLSEGKEAWLKHVRNGKIHGNVNTMGAVTGRMAHTNPNLAQVPAVRSEYGAECRALFTARPGWVLVGADAAALELRDLAHYMAAFDGGAYVKVVVEGRKEDGTEIHTVNRKALEIDSRDDAKTWFYAFLYGAGNEKLGMIITKTRNKAKNTKLGQALRTRFMRNLPAMGKLIERIKAKAKAQGWLTGLDGRRLFIRSAHAAPNTLFQAAGAIAMKKALVLLDNKLQTLGHQPGVDYEFVANVHDEWQIECRPEIADVVGQTAVESIRAAGQHFNMRCPLDGEFKVGRTWADTH